MLGHFIKSSSQLSDPAMKRVLLLGLAGALFTLILSYLLTSWGMNWMAARDFPWVDGAIDFIAEWGLIPIFIVASYFLFPALATMVMSVFLDDVVDAVEAQYYPHDRAPRPMAVMEGIMSGLRLGGTMLFWNTLALPLYVLLLFTAIGPFALYLVINGYLLGREYVELVSIRHLGSARAKEFRSFNRPMVLGLGVIGSGLFMVPIINLFAPLVLAGAAVHAFHAKRI